jgi:hypothetical protein
LFRAFFRAVLPHPWPACPSPPVRHVSAAPRRSLVRSRFALAASVGLLAAGLGALGGKFPSNVDLAPVGIQPGAGTASRVQPFGSGTIDPGKIHIKESLIQDGDEGTRLLIEVFDQ